MDRCEHCDSVGIVTIGGRLLCHEHALQAIAEKEPVCTTHQRHQSQPVDVIHARSEDQIDDWCVREPGLEVRTAFAMPELMNQPAPG
jgi:hypothetical protein